MDPKKFMRGNKPGQPSPMAQEVIGSRNADPFQEPKTLSSDSDRGGGVSLRPSKPMPRPSKAASKKAAANANAKTATTTTQGTRGDGHAAVTPQLQKFAGSGSDRSSSNKDDRAASQLKPTAEPFTSKADQRQSAKPVEASNLTPSAEAFVPQAAATTPTVAKKPSTDLTFADQLRTSLSGSGNGKPAGSGPSYTETSKTGGSGSEGAFAHQFDISQKIFDEMARTKDQQASTPGGPANGYAQAYGRKDSTMSTAAMSPPAAPAHGPASDPLGNVLLNAINTSTSQLPGAVNQPAGQPTPTTAQPANGGGYFEPSSMLRGQNNGLASTMSPGQGHQHIATSGPGNHHFGLGQASPSRGAYGNGNHNGAQYTVKATDDELKRRLANFASQAPFNAIPTGYRAGLPGSASEGTLHRQHASIASIDDSRANNHHHHHYHNAGHANNNAYTGNNNAYAGHVAHIRNSSRVDDGNGPVVHLPRSQSLRQIRSPELAELLGPTGIPSIQKLLDINMFPFEQVGRVIYFRGGGVLHLKNVPFNVDQAAITALMGKSAKVLHQRLEPIHVLMELVTGKTGDAYIETETSKDAMDIVERHQQRLANGQIDRLNDRQIELEASSLDALLQAVFKAGSTGVQWRGGYPTIVGPPPGQIFGHFKEFVPAEELTMILKHAENQTTFSKQCPERVYECMISILVLMPWSATHYITIKTRNQIYETVVELIKSLQKGIYEQKSPGRLTPQLLDRLANASMLCSGFTPLMKDNIASLVRIGDQEACTQFNQPPHAHMWLHQYGIAVKPGVPMDVLEYYITVIREETHRAVDEMSMIDKQEAQKKASTTAGYWGYFWREVNYPVGPDFDNMTIAEAGRREINTIEAILRRTVARQMGHQVAAPLGEQPMVNYY